MSTLGKWAVWYRACEGPWPYGHTTSYEIGAAWLRRVCPDGRLGLWDQLAAHAASPGPVVGDHTVTEVLTERRAEIAHQAQTKMQDLLTLYRTGLRVGMVQMQNVTPPSDEVKRAFNEVNEAQQEQVRKINEALQTYNQEVPRERGEAERTLAKAQGYAINRTNTARGDVARFNALLTEYRKAPEVTRRRLYLETMREILPTVKQVYVFDAEQPSSVLPFLDLQRSETAPVAPAGKEK